MRMQELREASGTALGRIARRRAYLVIIVSSGIIWAATIGGLNFYLWRADREAWQIIYGGVGLPAVVIGFLALIIGALIVFVPLFIGLTIAHAKHAGRGS